MIYKILIILSGLFGMFRMFRTTDIFARTILVGQIIAIALIFFSHKMIMTGGLLLFMLTLLLAIIYGLNKKDLKTSKRTLIIIPAVITLLTLFFQLQEYPGAGVLGLSNIISVIAYIIILTTDYKNYKNELGFLTIIATAGTIEVMRRIEWLLN